MKNTNKRINIKWVEWIVEFYKEREALGEKVKEITYKEDAERFSNYKFSQGHLTLTPYTSTIASFNTESIGQFEGDEVIVNKTYVFNKEENEFKVQYKTISY